VPAAALPTTTPQPRRASAVSSRTEVAILRATIATIATHGLSGTTIQLVANAARVATGTVILRFHNKDALLAATMESVALEFEQARRAAIEGANGDARAALNALIEVSFDPAVSDPARVAVWYAFWGEARARLVYLERIGAMDRTYQQDLERLCGELISSGNHQHLNAEAVAMGFAGILEWQWQDILVSGHDFDRAHARSVSRAYLANLFPEQFANCLEQRP
jgi:TetR/AcrR family transcriptional regulator, transcriptional repressor of bet genes